MKRPAKNTVLFLAFLLCLGSFKKDLSANELHFNSIGDTLHALHYEIHIRNIDMSAKTIEANTQVKLVSKFDNVSEILLQLIELTIDTVWVNGTQTTNYTHDNGIISIPFSLNADDTVLVSISYQGQPFHESWGGFHFSGYYAFNLGVGISEIPHNLGKAWFPCIDDFTDRAVYDVYATVDIDQTAVGGGELVEIITHGSTSRTFHWRINYPIPTYLVSVAVGEYELVQDTYNGIERDIPITYYVRAIDTSKVENTFINIKQITQIFEDHFGAYAWGRIGYVGTAIGAMEHVTNIAYPHFAINGNTTYEWLYAHELSHMWFGDKVTCCSAEEMWINEGWAVFCELYYTAILYNEEMFKTDLIDKHADVLQYAHAQEGGYWPLNAIPQQHTYGMSAYDKGATVVQTLRNYLGDSIFFNTMTFYLDSFAFTSVSSYDMRDLISVHTGINMNGFFDAWVLNGGTPHYSVDSVTVEPAGMETNVTVYVRQKRKGPYFIADDNIIEITFMDNNWNKYSDTIHFSGETGSSVKVIPFEPVVAFIDLENNMYDAITDNYSTINTTGDFNFNHTFFKLEVHQITDSAFFRVIHNWVPPDSLKNPVPDLRLSDYRYWKIDGILPEDFIATGRFYYSTSGYLDNTLITSSTDSVVILYRPTTAHDWQTINFSQLGPWNIGYLYVDTLKIGEYTIAVWDTQVGTYDDQQGMETTGHPLKISPNPSNGQLNISYRVREEAQIKVLDMQGKLLDQIPIRTGQGQITWDAGELPGGTYFIFIQALNNKIIASEKVLIAK